jgi:hypothetical protein
MACKGAAFYEMVRVSKITVISAFIPRKPRTIAYIFVSTKSKLNHEKSPTQFGGRARHGLRQ